MSGEKQSTRDKAAAARQAAEAQEKARTRRIQIIGGAVIALVVVGIIAVGVLGSRSNDNPNPDLVLPSPTAGAPLPTGVLGADAALQRCAPIDVELLRQPEIGEHQTPQLALLLAQP